jgi:hypothetical protein
MKKVLLILFILSLFVTQIALCEDGGKITFLKGTCYVRGIDGEYKIASLNQIILSSDTVKTLKGSEVEITFSDTNRIIVTEDTEIIIHQSILKEKKYTNIGLLFGNIKFFIQKLMPENEHFEVNTITTTAGIRGTEFDVSLREDGAVLINVDKGSVETLYNDKKHVITEGKASVYYLTKEREDFSRRINYRDWRKRALQEFRKDPRALLKKMLERERAIIAQLKENKKKLEEFRKEWVVFLRRVQYLENRKMYKQEKKLIEIQISRTKKALVYFVATRKQLTIIRSIVGLSFRIEQSLSSEEVEGLPALEGLRKEYGRLSSIISKLNEAENQLKKVLVVLNRKINEIGE